MASEAEATHSARYFGLLLITLYCSFMPLTVSHLLCALLGSAGYLAITVLKPGMPRSQKKLQDASWNEEQEEGDEAPSEEEAEDSEAPECGQEDGTPEERRQDWSSEEDSSSAEETGSEKTEEEDQTDEEEDAEGEEGEEEAKALREVADVQRAAAALHQRLLSRAASKPAAADSSARPFPPEEEPPQPPKWLLEALRPAAPAEQPKAPALLQRAAPRCAPPLDSPEVQRLEEEVRAAKQYQSRLEAGETLDSYQMGKVLRCSDLERLLALRHAEQVIAQIGGVLLVGTETKDADSSKGSGAGLEGLWKRRSAVALPSKRAEPRSQPPPIAENQL